MSERAPSGPAGHEPDFAPWRAVPVREALERLGVPDDGPSRTTPFVIAVDGRSGAGKTTLAALLAGALQGAVVVHTDDVAWHHSFFDWQDPMIEHVLGPARAGRAVAWRPDPWVERGRDGVVEVPAGCRHLIVEGAGASRDEHAPYLDARVWVASDPGVARAREIERDGDAPETLAFIEEWAAAERAFFAARRPWQRADLVVAGTPDALAPGADVAEGRVLVGAWSGRPGG